MEPFTYQSGADEPISHAVVAAVASVSDCRPTNSGAADSADVLPQLYQAIDPDALDALFRRSDRSVVAGGAVEMSTADGSKRVAFSYHGLRVTARSDGSVTVEPE